MPNVNPVSIMQILKLIISLQGFITFQLIVSLQSTEIVCSQLVPGNVGRRARPIPFPIIATASTIRGETRLKI